MARIMVVDDDPTILFLMRETFAEGGRHAVDCFSDSQKAMEDLQDSGTELPAVIVLDILMPAIDGVAFAQFLAKDPKLRAIPIVAISADHTKAQVMSVMENVWSFFTNPCDRKALRESVSRALAETSGPSS